MFKNRKNLVSISSLGGKKTHSKTVVQRCFVKKEFLKILQNSQEKLALESLFNRVTGLRCFNVNFAKFLRTH